MKSIKTEKNTYKRVRGACKPLMQEASLLIIKELQQENAKSKKRIMELEGAVEHINTFEI